MPKPWPAFPRLSAKAAGLLVFPLLAVALAVFTSRWALTSRDAIHLQQEQARANIRTIDRFNSQFSAATSATQEFLFTGNDASLAPYRAFRDAAPDLLRELRNLHLTDAGVQVKLDHLTASLGDQERVWTELRAQAALPGVSTPNPSEQALHESVQYARAIAADIAALRAKSDEHLNAQTAALAAIDSRINFFLVANVLFGIVAVLAGFLLWLPDWTVVEQEKASDEVSASLASLHRELDVATDTAFESLLKVADLKDETRILESVLRSINDGVVVTRADGTVRLANPSMDHILGGCLRRDPLHPLAALSACAADSLEAVSDAHLPLPRALAGESGVAAEYLFHASPGSEPTHIVMTAHTLYDEKHALRGAVLLARDVTEERRAAARLSATKQEAEAANRAKSDFLSRMSHELRTPLNAILGFAQLLEMGNLDGKDLDSVGQILKAGRHLLLLINEVLDISRIESGRLSLSLEPIQADELIEEALVMVEPLVQQAGLRLEGGSDSLCREHLLADRQRLKQVLLNLLSNAVKYNRPQGAIAISCFERGDRLRIAVRDTGYGIPADKLDLLFQPFERLGADESGVEGTGIGLALTRRLVEAMGGEIGVESEPGRGSTFWVQFPHVVGTPVVDSTYTDGLLAAAAAVSEQEVPTILCIEDNPSNLRLIEQILAHRPHIQLLTARQGAMGLQLAQDRRPKMILLDVHLGDMDGGDVLRELQANPATADIPVTIVSADATERQRERMLAAGARNYLTKPLEVLLLLEEVDEVFAMRELVR